MGTSERWTKDADVGDSYVSLANLLGLPSNFPTEVVLGDLNVQVSGLTYVTVPRGSAKPDDTVRGVQYPSGTIRVLDSSVPGYGFRLDEMYVKETTPAGGCIVVVSAITRSP
jgi:hypothetical protein